MGTATGVVGASDGECETRDQDGGDSVGQNEDLSGSIDIEIDIETLEGDCLSGGTGAYPAVRLLEDGLQVQTALQTPSPCHEVVLESAVVRERGGDDRPDDEDDQADGNDGDGNGDKHPDRSTTELVVRLRPDQPADEACIQCVGTVTYCLSVTFSDLEARPEAFRLVHESFADPRTVLSLEWPAVSDQEDGGGVKNDTGSDDE
ncbi:hypothetical protein ACFQMM_00970 [Saliphagus sp. GCM10025308]